MFRPITTLGLIAVLAAACGPTTQSVARDLLGRWERVGQPNVEDPLASLAAEHVEFREQGLLAVLLFDEGPGQYWTVGTGGYAILEPDRLQITGKCWQGFESRECAREYRLLLDGDRLTLLSLEAAGGVEYRRAGPLEPEPPPTLAPPRPSATPAN